MFRSSAVLAAVRLLGKDLKPGTLFEYKNAPNRVLESRRAKPNKGGSVMQTKFSNLMSGAITTESFPVDRAFNGIETEKVPVQYSYTDGGKCSFLNSETFELTEVPEETVGLYRSFLVPGLELSILYWNDAIVDFFLPTKVNLKVTEVPSGSQGSVTVTTETGLTVKVPNFISVGDTILVNTHDGSYVQRTEQAKN
eukprot:Rmarinus@m.3802